LQLTKSKSHQWDKYLGDHFMQSPYFPAANAYK